MCVRELIFERKKFTFKTRGKGGRFKFSLTLFSTSFVTIYLLILFFFKNKITMRRDTKIKIKRVKKDEEKYTLSDYIYKKNNFLNTLNN